VGLIVVGDDEGAQFLTLLGGKPVGVGEPVEFLSSFLVGAVDDGVDLG